MTTSRKAFAIRGAVIADAEAICAVIRASITELCGIDHGNNPEHLEPWLANKNPETVRAWLANPDGALLVAVRDDAVIAAGGLLRNGHITLNYVSPAVRFQGVSRAMLAALEDLARAFGNDVSTLVSTQTAHRFYLSAGYADAGPTVVTLGIEGYPMSKLLTPVEGVIDGGGDD